MLLLVAAFLRDTSKMQIVHFQEFAQSIVASLKIIRFLFQFIVSMVTTIKAALGNFW